MATRDRRPRLVQALIGVRRAGRRSPDDPALAAARVLLEEDLGATVSRRLAAEVLGLSRTALPRWIDRGEIPVVYTESGRTQIPVAVLLDLYEQVNAERIAGRGIQPGLLSDIEARDEEHRPPQLRGVAYHRALGKRLTGRWSPTRGRFSPPGSLKAASTPIYASQWRELLSKPVAEQRRQLGADTPQMADLRQSSLFAGMLSERERRAVMAAAAAEML